MEIEGTPLAVIVNDIWSLPQAFTTLRVTLYIPITENSKTGFCEWLLVPLAKLHPDTGLTTQVYWLPEPVELFVRFTLNGTHPEFLSTTATASGGS